MPIRFPAIDTVYALPAVSLVNTTGAPALAAIPVRAFSPTACTVTGLPAEPRTVSPNGMSASTPTTTVAGAKGAGVLS